MDLLKEISQDYAEKSIQIVEAITNAVRELKLAKNGGKVSNQAIRDFIKSNPSLTQAATINALSSYDMYRTNKRGTISLFARTPYDKKQVKSIVKSMVDSKTFKLHRTRYADNGLYYELQRIKSGF